MKLKIFTLLTLCVFMSFGSLKAQLYLEENFDYTAGPFIQNPVVSSANLQANGWSTQTSSNALNDSWDITSPGLTYNGYYTGAAGNALSFINSTTIGPSVYKSWQHAILQDSTIYISFLINFASNAAAILSPDFFMGIKMSGSFSDTNWGADIFASYDPSLAGNEINLSIKKGSTQASAVYATNNLPINTTHLLVLKYKMGKVGSSAATDTPYDDQMSLFINPPTTGGEPSSPTLYTNDSAAKDLYRWGASKPFGGLVAVYLRSPSVAGNSPLFTIDAIRVGLSWSDVIKLKTDLNSTTANDYKYSIDQNKQLSITTSNYSIYNVFSVSGQKVLTGNLQSNTSVIDVSSLKSGIYILNLQGSNNASTKIIVQ